MWHYFQWCIVVVSTPDHANGSEQVWSVDPDFKNLSLRLAIYSIVGGIIFITFWYITIMQVSTDWNNLEQFNLKLGLWVGKTRPTLVQVNNFFLDQRVTETDNFFRLDFRCEIEFRLDKDWREICWGLYWINDTFLDKSMKIVSDFGVCVTTRNWRIHVY